MKKTTFLLVLLLMTLFGCIKTEDIISPIDNIKELGTYANLPKPKHLNAKQSRDVAGIIYNFDKSGYQYSETNNGFRCHVQGYVHNGTSSQQIVYFKIKAFGGSSSCVKLESINSLIGGGDVNVSYSNPYEFTWNPANSDGEFMDPGQSCYVNFTLIIKDPYACVEGSWYMQLFGSMNSQVNYTDDYIYLIQ